MRACLVAGELARRDGLPPVRLGEVYYSTLMRYAGCAATSHEAAAAFGGDDIAVRARGDLVDTARPAEAVRFLASLGTGVERLRVLARMPRVPGLVAAGARADCEVGAELTTLLGLPSAVTASVLCAFERYDGKGAPVGRSGDELPEPARYAAVGHAAVMFDAVGGPGLAVENLTRWSGRALDPRITGSFLDASRELLELCGSRGPVGDGRCRRAGSAPLLPGRRPPGRGAGGVRRCGRPQGPVLPGPLAWCGTAGAGSGP